jgi:hypothetical protein
MAYKNNGTTIIDDTGSVNLADQTLTRAMMVDYSLKTNARGSISGAQTIDLTLGNFITATASGAITWTFTNPIASPNACGFILELTNGGVGSQTWPAAVKWPAGTAPTLTASGIDVLVFITDDGGTTWRGVGSMIDSK